MDTMVKKKKIKKNITDLTSLSKQKWESTGSKIS